MRRASRGLILWEIAMDIRLVATDMDGTLLNSRKEIPGDFIPWVKNHPQIQTVIASGRQYFTLHRDFSEIADNLIFIAENGSFVFEKGEMVCCNQMSAESVMLCLDQLRSYPQIVPIVCGAQSAYTVHSDPETEHQAAIYYARLQFVEDLYAAARQDRIAKIALYFPNNDAQEVGKTWVCPHPSLKHTVSGRDWIDISNADINKGSAMREIQKRHGAAPDQCMAFGDYMNDFELLQSCTESYAMENAVAEIKAIAKHGAPSNEQAGVMQILQKMFP